MSDVAQRTMGILRPLLEQKSQGGGAFSDEEILALDIAGLKFDSLEKMELIMQIEDTFNVALDEDDVMACEKISDLVALIERNV